MKQKNARSPDAIAVDFNRLDRGNIFDKGGLLLEGKAAVAHGDWYDWLSAEFELSADTAENYMNVARLGDKSRTVRDLKLAATTLYDLAARENEDELPSILKELAKHATKTRLKPREAKRVITIGIGRHRFGDRPDATLEKLVEIGRHNTWYEKAITELKQNNPETSEAADAIVDEIAQAHWDAEAAEEAKRQKEEAVRQKEIKDETDNILDGPAPVLPKPAIPSEPQRIDGAGLAWAGADIFAAAMDQLRQLCAKPAQRFSGVCSSAELRAVSAFLISVAEVAERKAA